MHILALDVGTSHVEAAVLDAETATAVGPVARVPYALDHPTPDAAEVPAERLWDAVVRAARDATRTVHDVQAVGMDVMTPGLVLLDAADRPLTPIWTHLDRRSRPIARQVWAAVGAEFLASTGNRPLPGGMSVLGYRQLSQFDPHMVHIVKRYLHVNGWLGLHMTGECAFDPANASFTGLFNTVGDQQWSQRWCAYFDVDPAWLPPVLDGTTTLGTLRPAIAAELGVPAGIPLKLGTADTSSDILLAGMKPGDLMHSVGTTQVLAVLVDRPVPDARRLVRRLGVGPAFLHVTHNPVGGAALEWLRGLCFHEQSADEFYQRTVAEALQRQTRVTLDPPHLGGDRLEIEAHRAAFRDLTLATDRLDLLAALLQAMVRRHHDAVAALGVGDQFQRIFLTGGGAEVVNRLIPEYATATTHMLQEGAVRGVARLFHSN
jgi:xylulokinase